MSELEELQEKVKKLESNAALAKKEHAGAGRLVRKVQLDLAEKAASVARLEKELEERDESLQELRPKLASTSQQILKLQRIISGRGQAQDKAPAALAALPVDDSKNQARIAELEAQVVAVQEQAAAQALAVAEKDALLAQHGRDLTRMHRESAASDAALESELSRARAELASEVLAKEAALVSAAEAARLSPSIGDAERLLELERIASEQEAARPSLSVGDAERLLQLERLAAEQAEHLRARDEEVRQLGEAVRQAGAERETLVRLAQDAAQDAAQEEVGMLAAEIDRLSQLAQAEQGAREEAGQAAESLRQQLADHSAALREQDEKIWRMEQTAEAAQGELAQRVAELGQLRAAYDQEALVRQAAGAAPSSRHARAEEPITGELAIKEAEVVRLSVMIEREMQAKEGSEAKCDSLARSLSAAERQAEKAAEELADARVMLGSRDAAVEQLQRALSGSSSLLQAAGQASSSDAEVVVDLRVQLQDREARIAELALVCTEQTHQIAELEAARAADVWEADFSDRGNCGETTTSTQAPFQFEAEPPESPARLPQPTGFAGSAVPLRRQAHAEPRRICSSPSATVFGAASPASARRFSRTPRSPPASPLAVSPAASPAPPLCRSPLPAEARRLDVAGIAAVRVVGACAASTSARSLGTSSSARSLSGVQAPMPLRQVTQPAAGPIAAPAGPCRIPVATVAVQPPGATWGLGVVNGMPAIRTDASMSRINSQPGLLDYRGN